MTQLSPNQKTKLNKCLKNLRVVKARGKDWAIEKYSVTQPDTNHSYNFDLLLSSVDIPSQDEDEDEGGCLQPSETLLTASLDMLRIEKAIVKAIVTNNLEMFEAALNAVSDHHPNDLRFKYTLLDNVVLGCLRRRAGAAILRYCLEETHLNLDTFNERSHSRFYSPLHYAIALRDSGGVDFLLALGAKIYSLNLKGNAPLLFDYPDRAMLEIFSQHGFDWTICNANGENILFYLQDVAALEFLVEKGVEIDFTKQNNAGETLLESTHISLAVRARYEAIASASTKPQLSLHM